MQDGDVCPPVAQVEGLLAGPADEHLDRGRGRVRFVDPQDLREQPGIAAYLHRQATAAPQSRPGGPDGDGRPRQNAVRWPLRRFRFRTAKTLVVKHTFIHAGRPLTNGCVERVQQTIPRDTGGGARRARAPQ